MNVLEIQKGVAQFSKALRSFWFQDPTILDFTPKVGPKSGGTAVTIRGEYIDAGRNITADFDGFACLIKREQDVWNETTVRCKTSRINTTSSAKLRMHFDGAERLAPDSKSFRYTENQTVKSINPSRSFRSGGRQVNVTGTMFTSVQEPRMVLSSEDGIHVGQPCQVYSQSSMQCLSPAFYSGDSAGPENNDITVGFLVDAVEDLLQLDLDFTVVSDPVYFEFPEEGNMKEQSGKQLNIRGSDLNLACTSEEVHVSVGQAECIVESLSDVQLNCVPPEEEPAAVNKTGSPTRNGYPEVRVEVGYQSFYIGYLKYRRADRLQTTTTIVVVSIIFLLVGIVATIGLGVILRNKIKHMDKRMDLANGIPKIMELTEMESDKRFQLLDYGDYAANMLFGGKNHDLVLNTSKKRTPADSRCLEDFRSLLRDKVFCVVFIRTLENRDDITPEDGSLIASLLTVVLHKEDHLMHFTEVLKVLLAEVVRNAVRGKRNAPLLERNNMITEKLVFNWLSLTLYKFIKFVVGKHLLRLVTSVQHEIEQNAEVTEVDIVHYLNDK
ncbi:plexin-B2-like [Ptychodera flava]|uniref:plexin-B2-like n=1 Tax=Ptychodera flava TaxID=63121 RepID=UPI003969D502